MTTRPYRPSNGGEGESFMNRFCFRCRQYDQLCDIQARAMGSTVSDPRYPQEWVEEDISLDSYPTLIEYLIALNERCTAFDPKSAE